MSLLRRRRDVPPPLDEAEAYARSYGERSDEVTNVKPVPASAESEQDAERKLSDRSIRDAFRARLDRRDPS